MKISFYYFLFLCKDDSRYIKKTRNIIIVFAFVINFVIIPVLVLFSSVIPILGGKVFISKFTYLFIHLPIYQQKRRTNCIDHDTKIQLKKKE